MRDAISGLIGRYDPQGRYFDRMAIDRIETFLGESDLRIRAVELINRDAAEIVREASQTLFLDEPELLLPGGNAYTTRRLAACLRDMDYFLRYARRELFFDSTATAPLPSATTVRSRASAPWGPNRPSQPWQHLLP